MESFKKRVNRLYLEDARIKDNWKKDDRRVDQASDKTKTSWTVLKYQITSGISMGQRKIKHTRKMIRLLAGLAGQL